MLVALSLGHVMQCFARIAHTLLASRANQPSSVHHLLCSLVTVPPVLYHDVLLIVLQAKEGFYAMLDESKDLEVTAGYRPKFSRARDMLELDPRWQVGCRDGWAAGLGSRKGQKGQVGGLQGWVGGRNGPQGRTEATKQWGREAGLTFV